MKSWIYSVYLASFLVACVAADVVQFNSCEGHDNSQCEVTNVQVSPCDKPERCVLRGSKEYSFGFDFKPSFDTATLKNRISTIINGQDILWYEGFDTNACHAVQCPVVANQVNSYSASTTLEPRKVKSGVFTVKWELLNEDESKSCCFTLGVHVKKH